MAISKQEIENLAELARLDIKKEEVAGLQKDFERILEYVSEIKNAKVDAEEVSVLPPLRNVFRDDTNPHKPNLYTEAIFKNATNVEDKYIKVKKIL